MNPSSELVSSVRDRFGKTDLHQLCIAILLSLSGAFKASVSKSGARDTPRKDRC